MDSQEDMRARQAECRQGIVVKGTTQQPDPRQEGEDIQIRIIPDRGQAEVPVPTTLGCATNPGELLHQEDRHRTAKVHPDTKRRLERA